MDINIRVLFDVLTVTIVEFVYLAIISKKIKLKYSPRKKMSIIRYMMGSSFLLKTSFSVLAEEFIFRLPIFSLMAIQGVNDFSLILPLSIFSSILFGFAHGGRKNILHQGVGGFLLCILPFRCIIWGDIITAILISSITHYLFNLIMTIMVSLRIRFLFSAHRGR